MENSEFLKAIELFADLPGPVLDSLASKMLELRFEKGRRICQENDSSDALFIIKSGICQIYMGDGAEKRVLVYLKRGDYFGEMAIFTGDPRSASVDAIADVTVLGLQRSDFEAEVRRSPALALELLKTLSRRLKEANQRNGKTGSKQGKLLFLTGSEKAAGKSVIARDLAAALATECEAKVILLDPNVQNPAVAKGAGVDEDCDLARELVSSDSVTIERYVKQAAGGFDVLLPQRVERTTYPLRESHHHVLLNGLIDKYDYVVVDSSSTMAQFNKHMMKTAAQILVVLSGAQESLASPVQMFENLLIDQNKIDRRRVHYVFNALKEPVEDPEARLGNTGIELMLRLPHDPEALAQAEKARTPTVLALPQAPWSQALSELARQVFRNHSLEILIPEGEAEAARKDLEKLARGLTETFGEEPSIETISPYDHADPESGPGFRLEVRATDDSFTDGMNAFLQQASDLRDRLGLKQILVRVDGRPSLL